MTGAKYLYKLQFGNGDLAVIDLHRPGFLTGFDHIRGTLCQSFVKFRIFSQRKKTSDRTVVVNMEEV